MCTWKNPFIYKNKTKQFIYLPYLLRLLSYKGLIGIKYIGILHEGRSHFFGEAHNFLQTVYGDVRQKKAILQTILNVTKRTYCRFYSYGQISFLNFMAAMGYLLQENHYKRDVIAATNRSMSLPAYISQQLSKEFSYIFLYINPNMYYRWIIHISFQKSFIEFAKNCLTLSQNFSLEWNNSNIAELFTFNLEIYPVVKKSNIKSLHDRVTVNIIIPKDNQSIHPFNYWISKCK